MHFSTFQLTTEGIGEPIRGLKQARADQRLADSVFRMLALGETEYLVN